MTGSVSDDEPLDFAMLDVGPRYVTHEEHQRVIVEEMERIEAESAAPSAPTIPHASYLGASDVAAVLGLDPYRTALDVWCEKTGRGRRGLEDIELEAGNDHEAGVVAGAARRLKRAGVARRVVYPGPGTIRDGWRGATLDAGVEHRDLGMVPLEAKYVGRGQAAAWGPEAAGAEGVPVRVLVQVHWQAAHARWLLEWPSPIAYVAADIGTDRRVYEVAIDDEMIVDLIAAGDAWWKRHVVGGEIPPATERDVETLALVFPRARVPLSPFVPDEVVRLAEEFVVAREIAARHRREFDRLGAQLRELLGDREGYRWRGGSVTWTGKPRALRVRVREERDR